ncbi:MAG: hypothetical protein WAL10_29580 [Acetobacteraceae bacterium]|jgi:hypothetical protein
MPTDREWLDAHRDELVRRNTAIDTIDRTKIDIDIQARLMEAKWAELYVAARPTLIEILDKLGITEKEWCRKLGPGFSYSTVMRRIQVLKGCDHYLRRRLKVGDNGCFGLKNAAYLARPEKPDTPATSSPPGRPQIADETPYPDPDHQFITSEAHIALPKLPPQSVQVCITSPGYWPARRLYNLLADGSMPLPTPDDIGHEPTWEAYLNHVVRRDFREFKPVLRPDGVVFVVLDDVIAHPGSSYWPQTYDRGRAKQRPLVNLRTQDTTYLRKKGNWLGLPFRFAEAMMDDGWYHRDTIIWDKGSSGRRESTDSRCRHQFRIHPDVHPLRRRLLVRSGPAAHPIVRRDATPRIFCGPPQTTRPATRWRSRFSGREQSAGTRRRRRLAHPGSTMEGQ